MTLQSSNVTDISLDEADYRFLKALDEYSDWLREEMALPLASIISTAKSKNTKQEERTRCSNGRVMPNTQRNLEIAE